MPNIKKAFNKLAMSKPVGKILSNPAVKKVAIPLGKAAIKAVKAPGRLVAGAMQKNQAMAKAKDMKNRMNAPVGALGGLNTGAYKGSSSVKGRSTSNGYMPNAKVR